MKFQDLISLKDNKKKQTIFENVVYCRRFKG